MKKVGMKKLKRREKMFFNKKKRTQEQLNEEFSKLNKEEVEVDTEVLGTDDDYIPEPPKTLPRNAQKPSPKVENKPKNSHSEPVSEETDDNIPFIVKESAEVFNQTYGGIIEPDKNFNVLFALYCEQRRTNKLLEGLGVLLEDLNQKAAE